MNSKVFNVNRCEYLGHELIEIPVVGDGTIYCFGKYLLIKLWIVFSQIVNELIYDLGGQPMPVSAKD